MTDPRCTCKGFFRPPTCPVHGAPHHRRPPTPAADLQACTCQGFYQPPDCPVHGIHRPEPINGMEPDDPRAEFLIDGRGRSLRSLMDMVRYGHVSEEEAVRLLRDWKGCRPGRKAR